MEEKYKVIQETIEIAKDNGNIIRGTVFRPDEEDTKFPAVIFSHGFGSNYHELIHHGEGYAASGIVCVFFDFCGGGDNSTSDGAMLEMTVLTEADDLETVLDAVKDMPFVDNAAVYLQGESQGGFVSAIVGNRRRPDVNGLILWYPAFIIPDDAKKRLKIGNTNVFGHEISAEYNKVAAGMDAKKIQKEFGKPVLILHGTEDGCVPIEYSRKAAANYAFSTLKEIDGAGHGFNGKDSSDARTMSIAFIEICENLKNLYKK